MSAAESPRRFADWHATDKRWYAVIVLAAVAVRLLTWQGIGYLDSLNYAEASLGILDHGLGTGLGFHQVDRLGMTVPPAALLAVFGRSEFVAVSYFLALSIAGLVVIPRLLARLVAPRVALVATMLYALTPLTIRDSTTNGADLAMATWVNFAILALLTAPGAKRGRRFFAAGAMLGIAAFHKETAVVMLPVAAAIAFFAGDGSFGVRTKQLVALGLGFAGPMLTEAVAFHAWTGDPIFRYRHIEETHGPSLAAMESAGLLVRYTKYWPSALLESPQNLGVLLFVLPGALLVHSIDRFRSVGWRMALWFLFPVLYTFFGTSTMSAWRPLLPYPRYLHFALLPGAVLAAQILTDGSVWPRTQRAVSIALGGALLAAACMVRDGGLESIVAGAAGVLLLATAGRGSETPVPAIALGLVLLPVAMIGERLTGRTRPVLQAERDAAASVRRHGFREIRCTSPTIWAMQLLSNFGELPGVAVISEPPDRLAVSPEGTIVLASDHLSLRLSGVRNPDGSPAFESTDSFRGPWGTFDGSVIVLRRRGGAKR